MTTATEGAGLRAEDLAKSYRGRRVVDGVSVRIAPGEVVGLLGPNGAGKTTSFYLVLGLVPPQSGRVLLDGEEITSFPMYVRARKGIGYLPQEASIFRRMTVEENVRAVLEVRGLRPDDRPDAIRTEIEADTRDLLLVGHMPGISDLARALAPGAAVPLHGYVVLQRTDAGWQEVRRVGRP